MRIDDIEKRFAPGRHNPSVFEVPEKWEDALINFEYGMFAVDPSYSIFSAQGNEDVFTLVFSVVANPEQGDEEITMVSDFWIEDGEVKFNTERLKAFEIV